MVKLTQQDIDYRRELVWLNALDLFNKKNNFTHKSIINAQKKYIHHLNLLGKNKYKTVYALDNYFKNPDKNIAETIFNMTVDKKISAY